MDYCLSPDHEDGQHKARLFQTLLGLTGTDSHLMIDALRRAAASGEAVLGKHDKYGQRYVIDFPCSGPARSSTIRSVWIIGPNESLPRLVTCFIL